MKKTILSQTLCLAKEKVRHEIRYMTEKDLPAILQMASEEGWISDLVEFETFIEINPFGCFVCVKDNKVVGSIMTFHHTESAWIGNFIVSKKYRGRGIGKKLLSQAIEYLDRKKKKQIYLNADFDAENLYEKFGFKKIMPVNRWQGKTAKSIKNIEGLQESIPDVFDFIKLDASLWKDERFFLITQLSFLRYACSHYEPSGFLMYGGVGCVGTIGPWELKNGDKKVAEKLFISGLAKLKSRNKILLDVPAVNKEAERILAKYNFKNIGSTMFMCRGKLPKIDFDGIFSFATMGSMG